jgi:predicted aldo/keto reductase-like oxidoreductase
MQYRLDKISGNKLSVLGLGCMRFPKNIGGVDLKKTENIIMSSIEHGINYFDTAWIYPGIEEALGIVLERNRVRDKIFIATKLPTMLVGKEKDLDHFFNEQVKRLRTEKIDYYLMHNLTDLSSWQLLVKLGIESWISGKKKSGQISQIGFSFHGTGEEFVKILNAYPWEFCLIQYNYSDINFQAGVKGLRKAAETMPVIIMEPLLGGKLAGGLPPKAKEIFCGANKAAGKEQSESGSPAAWGLRWLWNQGEVTSVLSGMNDTAQIEENARLTDACAAGSLSVNELAVYDKVREIFNASYKIPCTGCGYCLPCPKGVNIPGSFAAYNNSYVLGWGDSVKQYVNSTGIASATGGSSPANCVSCGACEKHCPQKIAIAKSLTLVLKRMEPFPINIIIKAARAFMRRVKKPETSSGNLT